MIKKLIIYSLIIIICSCKKENKIVDPPIIPPTQTPNIADTIEWQKCLGGSNFDVGKFAIQTSDGGYAIIGAAISMDGDVNGHHSGNVHDDMWIVKLNNLGNIEWQKCLGGTISDFGLSIQQTTDGGYILGGGTSSHDGDVTGNHSNLGSNDLWLIKLDNSGSIQWKKCYGGTSNDAAYCIQQTTDGGFIAVGYTQSNDSDVVGNHGGNSDIWVIKINNTGSLSWQKCLGGSDGDVGYSIQQTTDGGYIIAGETRSSDGDVTSNFGGVQKGWIIRLNATGGMQWNKCIGEGTGKTTSVQQTSDGGYIATGSTQGNISNHGLYDAMVVKLNSTGGVIWNKCYGGTNYDYGKFIIQTINGNYTLAAESMSNDGDVSGNHSTQNLDFWIVGLDTLGVIQWKKCYGGNSPDEANSIMQTTDGGYVVCGSSRSNDHDVSGNHSSDYDFWIFKLF